MGLMNWMFGATPGQQAGQAGKEMITGVFEGLTGLIDEIFTTEEERKAAKLKVLEHQLNVTKTFLEDVQSARTMQIQTKSIWPGIISTVVLAGFFGGGGYILVNGLKEGLDEVSKNIINMFAVQLMAGVSAVWGFWLGSSYGSQSKDDKLYRSTPKE